MSETYCIGGSTCCGKSSIAEILCQKHGLTYFKLDDFLDPYMERLAQSGSALCKKTRAFSMEEMWMRPPKEQCREELAIYREMYPLAAADIAALPGPVLAEGAGFLPELMHRAGVDPAHYICITPTREFQLAQYAQRPWIHHYLAGCSDPEQAFANWMERDALFAKEIRRSAASLHYRTMLVDGSRSIEEHTAIVEALFRLGRTDTERGSEP